MNNFIYNKSSKFVSSFCKFNCFCMRSALEGIDSLLRNHQAMVFIMIIILEFLWAFRFAKPKFYLKFMIYTIIVVTLQHNSK